MHVHLGTPAFSRYTAASLLATGVSQLVLVAVYAVGEQDAVVATLAAFAAGAVPHFVLVRWWAWGQRGVPKLTGQLTGYLVTTAIGGAITVALTGLADWAVAPLIDDRVLRAVVLNATYVVSGLPVFLAKYAVFDRVFGGQAEYDSTNSTRVLAANPVAPGTTSS
ncbi:GtrA family protein [Actinokineospora sp. G85]|uniref:GtrA family protein n=1 Tax=Actinokineospora sp. G85 TaxID=3406626 RepID=UPI003C7135D7